MAYAFGFPQDVTDLIYSMRDWRWEMVRDGGKAPSARCFNALGARRITGDPYDKPLLLPMRIPYYHVESDSEDSDFGEVVIDHWNRGDKWRGEIRIERYYPAGCFTLRKFDGRVPAKFRRLQKQNEQRIKDLWFQCEPCDK